jgi:hypothetical protein
MTTKTLECNDAVASFTVPAAARLQAGSGRIVHNRDSPDEPQTGINVRVSPALLQDRREVLTATSTLGNPNAWSRV